MKKKKHIVLWILLAVVILICGVLFWQRDNIKAAIIGLKSTPEEIEAMLEANTESMQKSVEQEIGISVRALTEEEKEALRSGSLDESELIDELTEDELTPYQKEMSDLIAKIYVMYADYTGILTDMYDQAKREYKAKTDAEKEKKALVKWGAGYIDRAASLEKQCDGEMDEILARMETLIKENGGDLSLIDQIIEAYANEKSLQKSWYLAKMEKGGILG